MASPIANEIKNLLKSIPADERKKLKGDPSSLVENWAKHQAAKAKALETAVAEEKEMMEAVVRLSAFLKNMKPLLDDDDKATFGVLINLCNAHFDAHTKVVDTKLTALEPANFKF